MSTHNLCFKAKIRKKVYPCKPQFCYIKVGCKGVIITWTCYPDVTGQIVDVFVICNFQRLVLVLVGGIYPLQNHFWGEAIIS